MDNKSMTFKAKIVAYQDPKNNWEITLQGVQDLIDSGEYEIEFIMPLGFEPTIIIKPKE
mgnify:CR=1 FL=1